MFGYDADNTLEIVLLNVFCLLLNVQNFWKDLHLQSGYELVVSPHIAKLNLWQTSGHYEFYSESMFDKITVEDEFYQLKPMNCPFHIAIFQDGLKSYRELPIRYAELGTVYRYEQSGTMHGLFRVRGKELIY